MNFWEMALLAGFAAVAVAAAIAWLLVRRVNAAFDGFRSRTNKRQQSALAEIGKLRGELEALRERTDEAERRAACAALPRLPASGLNANHRTQAIRMMRRGEAPDKIAAILGVPRTEIDLLRKVQRLLTADA